jgi:hypothetical protein
MRQSINDKHVTKPFYNPRSELDTHSCQSKPCKLAVATSRSRQVLLESWSQDIMLYHSANAATRSLTDSKTSCAVTFWLALSHQRTLFSTILVLW